MANLDYVVFFEIKLKLCKPKMSAVIYCRRNVQLPLQIVVVNCNGQWIAIISSVSNAHVNG